MKAITLLYHDVIPGNDYQFSGFSSAGADLYKFNIEEFRNHLQNISVISQKPVTIQDYLTNNQNPSVNNHHLPFFLTFDDGGKSAHSIIADILDEIGWKAHFFITTDYIGDNRFVNSPEIIDLRKRGHIIGSHSASHPAIMSALNYKELEKEWSSSKRKLEDITGEEIISASIPGGYYSVEVANAASDSGFTAMFTSEPKRRIIKVGNCFVIGRYTIFKRINPNKAASLASDNLSSCFGQWFYWNLKKAAKKSGGKYYLKIREMLAGRQHL